MWSSSQRAQTVFGLFTSVLFALAAAIALTDYLPLSRFQSDPTAAIDVSKVVVKYSRAPRSYSNKQQEFAHVQYDLTADLSSLFHWNTKQVFAYLVAEYPGTKFQHNEVTLWDVIIRKKQDAVLSLNKKRNKYAFGDITKVFDQRNATFSLHWNVMPHVGVLNWNSVKGSQVVTLPARNN
ncbi:Probable microsomal signal peptidase subunit 3 [Taphrina deformans PYCC 5710]|uniref:Signal peptidase subunit 3 n=1 Tax=Taphrina deformans (strain PYCC 5710 / ATCC 11124 / CBS 356.35 / IMI 108563 / JCM 9778 / NBRC 8474) TaxID=1097556 RepID=R4XAN8_TAPDE|nr:Probable microsomal signal peptidase subunit 3 [Taphrina deformans PYCC 5710]|eukprot:CCG82599.1 Probable microsomal signal peptidase subunit 3 [Taphrina deformans PYCC 5710]